MSERDDGKKYHDMEEDYSSLEWILIFGGIGMAIVVVVLSLRFVA